MKFCATRYEHGDAYAETVKADTWAEALTICKEHHWRLEGRHRLTLPAVLSDGVVDFILWLVNYLF